jgi:multisubunit Na+/H+ antiporter MnhC subunit
MTEGTGFALRLGAILTVVVIAVAITTWVAPLIWESASAAPTHAIEGINRPQYPLVY